jgi:alpha-beta hydrolase superfamily lysophospholipase
LIGCTVAGIAPAEIQGADFMARTVDGVAIGLRTAHDDSIALAGKPPVILLHGARVPGIASFDLPVAGGSLAADLARAGFRVFILDARGYGMSERPAAAT